MLTLCAVWAFLGLNKWIKNAYSFFVWAFYKNPLMISLCLFVLKTFQSANSLLIRLREMGSFESIVFQMNDCFSKTRSSKELFLPAWHDFYFSDNLLIIWLYCFSARNTNSFQWTCLLFLSEELSNRNSEITFLTGVGKQSFRQHMLPFLPDLKAKCH